MNGGTSDAGSRLNLFDILVAKTGTGNHVQTRVGELVGGSVLLTSIVQRHLRFRAEEVP